MSNVRIREYTDADVDALTKAVAESWERVQPYMPWCRPGYTRADAKQWVEIVAAGRQRGTFYDFAVEVDGKFAGGCGLNLINWVDRVANVGFWLRDGYQGKGFATESVRLLMTWAFANTELNRLEIVAAVDNAQGQRVAENVGATREAVLAQRAMVRGEPSDAILYAVLKDRFDAHQ